MICHYPQNENEAATIIQTSVQAGKSLRLRGGGTRSTIGRVLAADEIVSTQQMAGIVLYEPAEMVLSAKAGTPLEVVNQTLRDNKQMLTFEPMDHRPLLGTTGEPTLGAVAAGNISGPRRPFSGAARDSLIGVRFINGEGEIIKNGGRVMKNVTGLDLVKLQAGAWGTLGLLSEVTFKLLPSAQRCATLVLEGLEDEMAIKALCKAAGTPFEPTGLSHLPAGIGSDVPRTLFRVEGFSDQVDYRLQSLSSTLGAFGDTQVLEGETHDQLWQAVRDVVFLAQPRDKAVWKLSVRPTSAANVIAVIEQALDSRYFYDWSGGLIWLAVDETEKAGQETIRNAVNAAEGYATLVRGSEALRARICVFEPQTDALKKIAAGIKNSFDPNHTLNPGLMVHQ